MEGTFERERLNERLRITRLREEHATLLDHALRHGPPKSRQHQHRGVFRAPDRENGTQRDKPGATTKVTIATCIHMH